MVLIFQNNIVSTGHFGLRWASKEKKQNIKIPTLILCSRRAILIFDMLTAVIGSPVTQPVPELKKKYTGNNSNSK